MQYRVDYYNLIPKIDIKYEWVNDLDLEIKKTMI